MHLHASACMRYLKGFFSRDERKEANGFLELLLRLRWGAPGGLHGVPQYLIEMKGCVEKSAKQETHKARYCMCIDVRVHQKDLLMHLFQCIKASDVRKMGLTEKSGDAVYRRGIRKEE